MYQRRSVPARVRLRPGENETVQSKLGDEERKALHEMVAAKQVELRFQGRNPETGEQTRFIGIKAHPKMFSKRFWKVQVLFGNGRHLRMEIAGVDDDDIESQLWSMCLDVELDFQNCQRAEAIVPRR